jgi:hypothetical protein
MPAPSYQLPLAAYQWLFLALGNVAHPSQFGLDSDPACEH